jgi:hypothetical protein
MFWLLFYKWSNLGPEMSRSLSKITQLVRQVTMREVRPPTSWLFILVFQGAGGDLYFGGSQHKISLWAAQQRPSFRVYSSREGIFSFFMAPNWMLRVSKKKSCRWKIFGDNLPSSNVGPDLTSCVPWPNDSFHLNLCFPDCKKWGNKKNRHS